MTTSPSSLPTEKGTHMIIRGTQSISDANLGIMARAASFYYVCVDKVSALANLGEKSAGDILEEQRSKGVKLRCITEMTPENLARCREISQFFELRHLDNLKGNMAISDTEYLASAESLPSRKESNIQMAYSNLKDFVEQQHFLFDDLWQFAIPAETRITQLEEHVETEETRVIRGAAETYMIGKRLAEDCRRELLLILSSSKVIERNSAMFEFLGKLQAESTFAIRVLVSCPSESYCKDTMDRLIRGVLPSATWRRIEPLGVTFAINDRSRMLMAQYSDFDAATMDDAVLSTVYSTNKRHIDGTVAMFEALWRESELRQKAEDLEQRERRVAREARLLQDILAHDIRNYNQVIRLSAELLSEELKDNVVVQSILENILKSIDGSTLLLERTKRLGKVISEENPALFSVHLLSVLQNSMDLIKKAYFEKAILDKTDYDTESGVTPLVYADDLLAEVFTNLFSNAVKYTDGRNVPIEVKIEDAGLEWKVSVTDFGRGIPDELKEKVFNRYLESAKGSGLGMSIVHALVMERYRGNVAVRNRVPGDYTQGTITDVFLPKANLTRHESL